MAVHYIHPRVYLGEGDNLLLPLPLLVIVIRRNSLNRVAPDGNHTVDLGLLLLVVGDAVGQGAVDNGLHPEVSPDADGDGDKHAASNGLALTSRGFNFGQGLAEGGAVEGLLLLNSQLLPVTLLFGPQGSNFSLILLEPDCWEGGHDTVNVGGLAVATIPHNFPPANVNLLLSKGLASNGVTASILANCQFAPLGGKHTVFSHQSSHPVYLLPSAEQ